MCLQFRDGGLDVCPSCGTGAALDECHGKAAPAKGMGCRLRGGNFEIQVQGRERDKMNNGSKLAICTLSVAICALAVPAMAQMTSVGIDCSQLSAIHAVVQENLRVGKALIECGIVQGGRPEGGSDN